MPNSKKKSGRRENLELIEQSLRTPDAHPDFETKTRGDDPIPIAIPAKKPSGRPRGKKVEQVTVTMPIALSVEFKAFQDAMIDAGILISNESLWFQFAVQQLLENYKDQPDGTIEKEFKKFYRNSRR